MVFSIIIPIYNVELYIDECLQSILSQDFSDYEVLLINDGSKDKSGEICDRYAKLDQRIRVFHQINKGVSAARNLGIQKAIGEYIWFVDSDDYLEPDAISSLVELINQYDNIGVLGFNFKYFDTNELQIQPKDKIEFYFPISGSMYLNYYDRLSVFSFIYQKKFLIQNSLCFREGISYFEDNLFNLEVFNVAKKIVQTNLKLYNYRQNRGDSAMGLMKEKKVLDSIANIIMYLESITLQEVAKQKLDNLKINFLFSFLYVFTNYKDTNKFKLYSLSIYSNLSHIKIKNLETKEFKIEGLIIRLLKKKYLKYYNHFLVIFFKKVLYRIV